MDIDMAAPVLPEIVEADAPLDRVAHGLLFGEGPVWDRRGANCSGPTSSETRSGDGGPASAATSSCSLAATPTE